MAGPWWGHGWGIRSSTGAWQNRGYAEVYGGGMPGGLVYEDHDKIILFTLLQLIDYGIIYALKSSFPCFRPIS